MGSEWETAKLGEYIDSCLGKMLDKNKNTGEFEPYLGNSNVRWGYFELDDLAEMKFESHENERYGIKKGDLIICEGGEPGRCAIWNEDVPDMKIQKALHRVRTLPGLDSEYLYYWFLFSAKAGHIDAYFTGTTIKHLTGKALKEIPIKLPPLHYQRSAAKLLRSLDNKITLNRQINQTLEQMAQTLFKSWFVDFDPVIDNALDAGNAIPDELQARAEQRQALRHAVNEANAANQLHSTRANPAAGDALATPYKPLPDDIRQLFPNEFEESELGWVPKGWGVKSLDEVTSLIIDHRGKTPKKLGGDWSESGYPAISAKNIKNGRLVRQDTIRYVNLALYEKWMKNPLSAGDIVMTSEAPLGEMLYLPTKTDFLLSQRLYGIRANTAVISGSYLYYWLQTSIAKADLDGRATGTTVVGIRQSELRQVNVMTPNIEVVSKFDQIVSSYLVKCDANELQTRQLETLRDSLLPKLISGELRLDEVESSIEEKIA
ncbi:restriction endonuclease subunit S [Vibrio fluvialis]|uniref:restriction endonuclease subunit S n=1 Tax=Vibrio fluvialis TaxID=676 RepID=UPI003BA1C494